MNRKMLIFFLLFFTIGMAQNKFSDSSSNLGEKDKSFSKEEKPPVEWYKNYSLALDTTYLDTSLSIKKEYKFNFLRKDIFGLLPFANEGQTYTVLDYNLKRKNVSPTVGFGAKHFNYLEIEDIKYYKVPTPLSDLYFKTVMEQGQSLDAFLTVNTKPNFNFSIAYKGIRSIGKYINSISSSGNFRFTASYHTKNERYFFNGHFTGQDLSNQENGGIKDLNLFETSEAPYNQRERLDVYFNDATSFLKGNRFFFDHYFYLSKNENHKTFITHQFTHEYKFFTFKQDTANDRFGVSYSSSLNDKTRFSITNNQLGLGLETQNYGKIHFYGQLFDYNYYYKRVVYDNAGSILVPNRIKDQLVNIGVDYNYIFTKDLKMYLYFQNSISNQSVSRMGGTLNYNWREKMDVVFKYSKISRLPDFNFSLFQSNYVFYNWFNNFKNEKQHEFEFDLNSKWMNLTAKYQLIDDYLYFENTTNDLSELLVKPFQLSRKISYLSIKASRQISFWKLSLDNTFLYQKVNNSDNKLNLPQFVTRNSLYYSGFLFKKAMYFQTGVVFNYFTKYYANDYNPLIGDFYVQNQYKIGGFPMFDYFINAKVKQVRLFLKAEHFNSSFTGYNFYSAPNYPYRDFMVRFGLVWNFFK